MTDPKTSHTIRLPLPQAWAPPPSPLERLLDVVNTQPLSRALVACHNGQGVVLDYSGDAITSEIEGAGSRLLSDLNLDDAPNGLSVWEGRIRCTHVHTPDCNEWESWPEGQFRALTDEERVKLALLPEFFGVDIQEILP